MIFLRRALYTNVITIPVFAENPSVHLYIEDIGDRKDANVSCEASNGRPSQLLRFYIGEEIIKSETTKRKTVNETYINNAALTVLNSSWSGKKIKCCALNNVFAKEVCSAVSDFKYSRELYFLSY